MRFDVERSISCFASNAAGYVFALAGCAVRLNKYRIHRHARKSHRLWFAVRHVKHTRKYLMYKQRQREREREGEIQRDRDKERKRKRENKISERTKLRV